MRIPCRSSPRPARLHVIDTLRGVQVGGDPSRAERRRGHWSHGSPSAPTSAGRAGKSFLRKPREMSTRTARLGFLDGWGAGGRGQACGALRRVRGPWERSWATIRSAKERWRVPPYPRRPHLRSGGRTGKGANNCPSRKTALAGRCSCRLASPSVRPGFQIHVDAPARAQLRLEVLVAPPNRPPNLSTPLYNSRSFRALPALHEQLCAQRPPCLARWYRRFRRSKVRRPQRST